MLRSQHMLLLARGVLTFGAISLVAGGIRLFRRAIEAGFPAWHLAWILPLAIVLGAGKARFVMRKRMRQNIARLRATREKLWVWQIYPSQLLAFIVSMVVLMRVLKIVLAENAVGLAVLGGIDAALAAALGVASLEYRHREETETELAAESS